jgi:hypothetical protein
MKVYRGQVYDIDISDPQNEEEKEIVYKFKYDYLFQYFRDLSSGQAGWGLSFTSWLCIKGWYHVALGYFKKVEPINDD